MAKGHMADLSTLDPGPFQRRFRRHGRQIDRRGAGQRTAKGANRRPCPGQNYDIGHFFSNSGIGPVT